MSHTCLIFFVLGTEQGESRPARLLHRYESRVHDWLHLAQPGYCDGTDYLPDVVSQRKCEQGNLGGWRLTAAQARSWVDAVTICQQRCTMCANCNFISVSLEQRDCSWFRKCDPARLHAEAPSPAIALSFRSAHANVHARSQSVRKVWSGIQQAYSTVCRTHGGGFGFPGGPLHGAFNARTQGDIYQFGVAQGYSLRSLLEIFPDKKAWAFDTFSGMPNPENGEATFQVTWQRGAFNSGTSREQAARLPLLGRLADRVGAVVGRFQDSLTPTLAKSRGMSPAAYVDIDSDLYSSAFHALDWMFREGLITQGTVVGYDDYWDLACKHGSHHVELYGEAKAHAQMAEKYNVTFECVCGPCAPLPPRGRAPASMYPWGWRTYFVVVGFGRAASGLTLPMADARDFVLAHPPCRGLWDRNSSHWLNIV